MLSKITNNLDLLKIILLTIDKIDNIFIAIK